MQRLCCEGNLWHAVEVHQMSWLPPLWYLLHGWKTLTWASFSLYTWCWGTQVRCKVLSQYITIAVTCSSNLLALFPGLPPVLFFGSRLVQYTEAEQRQKKSRESLEALSCEEGGGMPDYKYICNKPKSNFLTGQVKYLWSGEHMSDRTLNDEV